MSTKGTFNHPNVIALLGRAGSGKSTAAQYLSERYGFERWSFATPLKLMAADLWGFSHEQLYGAEKEKLDARWGLTPREAMQRLGASARRHLGIGVWANALIGNLKGRVVIDDTRHINEVAALYAASALGKIDLTVVKIVCEDRESVADATHESEAEVDRITNVDIVVRNKRADGLEPFKAKLDTILACTR